MTEGLINLVDDDSSHDVQDAHGQEERLATTRFQPQGAPPSSRKTFGQVGQVGSPSQAGTPGHTGGVGPAGMVVPPPRSSYPAGASAPGGGLYPSEPPPPLPRTSWWRSLISSTVAPGSEAPAPPPAHAESEATADHRVGKTCLGMAFGFALLALLVALRAAPGEPPAVAVAIVTSRTVIALALIAFGYAVLRAGERFLRESR